MANALDAVLAQYEQNTSKSNTGNNLSHKKIG